MCDGWFNLHYVCPACNRLHAIRQCTRFLVMNVEQKLRVVAHNALCSNCLAQTHVRAKCNSLDRCKRCLQDHNTWLHPIPKDKTWVQMTANIRVITRPGKEFWSRALLDPNAARSSMMALEAESLRCEVRRGRTKIVVQHSWREGRRVEVDCVIEDEIYGRNPAVTVEREENHPRYGALDNAHRLWYKGQNYRMILGADVAPYIFTGKAEGRPGKIYVQDTIFGKVYFGEGRIKKE